MNKITLLISDLHIPFHNENAFDFLNDLRKTYKPTTIVCVGDVADMAAISHWQTDPDGMSPGDEHKKVLKHIKQFYKLFPNVIYTPGNHEIRPLKQAFNAGIPNTFMKTIKEYMELPPGWEVRDSVVVDNTYIWHGEPFTGRNAILNALTTHRMNVAFGHVHSNAGIQYMNNGHKQIWGMNTGCLINPDAYCFKYGKNNRDKPILGTGLIIDNVPFFHPMG